MDLAGGAVPRDSRGNPTFSCDDCGAPLTMSDFHAMHLREPEPSETAADYRFEELVDALVHARCAAARERAG